MFGPISSRRVPVYLYMSVCVCVCLCACKTINKEEKREVACAASGSKKNNKELSYTTKTGM